MVDATDSTADVRDARPSDGYGDELFFCDQLLPTDFACASIAPKTGASVCTDEAIGEIVATCFGDEASTAECSAAQTKYAACAKCAFQTWAYKSLALDVGGCMLAVAPESNCGDIWRCHLDCVTAVCSECVHTPGTSRDGGSATEYDDCRARADDPSGTLAKGACFNVATRELESCRLDPRFAVCFVDDNSGIARFITGACRDGGDWSKVTAPSDAGTG